MPDDNQKGLPVPAPTKTDPAPMMTKPLDLADNDESRRKQFEAWKNGSGELPKPPEEPKTAEESPAVSDPAADKAKGKGAKEKPVYEGEDVTYLPGPHDAPTTTWRGITFQANVPVRLKNMEHIAAVRGNKFFRIGSGKPEDNPNRDPADAMDYRAHVIDWMQHVTRIEEVCQKWSSEKAMRDKCEVGQDDVKYLGTLIESRLKQMRMAEGLSEVQVANLWIRYGTLDLPWRAA